MYRQSVPVYGVFSCDVTVAMLVFPTDPLGIETLFLSKGFLLLCFKNMLIDHVSENTLYNRTACCPVKKILDEKIQRNTKILPLIKRQI